MKQTKATEMNPTEQPSPLPLASPFTGAVAQAEGA
tara:strand:- start:102 stop:206 length:105 start_codon:yes stop_codon:yes gene_type:complete